MQTKTLIRPERRRQLTPPFAWIDRRYLFGGFLAQLSWHENLLYLFLVLAADRDGLITRELIAFDGRQFQVLALPAHMPRRTPGKARAEDSQHDAEALASIFNRLAKGGSDAQ